MLMASFFSKFIKKFAFAMPDKNTLIIVIQVGFTFFAMLAVYVLLRHYLFGSPWSDMLVEVLFFAAIITAALIGRVLPAFERALQTGFVYYLIFTLIVFALLLPGTAYFKAAQWVADTDGDALKITFFVLSGLIWLTLVAMLYPSRSQAWLFDLLKALGWFTPFIFLFNYIVVSLVLFGFFAYYLFGPGDDGTLDSDSYLNLFGYHFLDSIPALKVPATLRLTEPIPGDRPFGLGALLLLFKFTVLIPGVGAFVAYSKSGKPKAAPETKA